MKLFVGWPYDAVWVEEYVIPLIKTYGITVLTGKELEGRPISEGVIEKMKGADAALFFLTRRGDPDNMGLYRTSDWVVDEIKHANSIQINIIIEVKEDGVIDYPNKIHPERQHMILNPADRMKFMVELGEIMGKWRGHSLKLKLSPGGISNDKQFFEDELKKRLRDRKYECMYQVRQQGTVIHGPKGVEIVREDHGFFYIYTDELPDSFFNTPDMYLEVVVTMGDEHWACSGMRPNVLVATLD
jgi:hypothetical protein